jgi:SAM-dependent methyltransferase
MKSRFEERYFEDPSYPPGLKGGDEVRGYGYYPDYFPIIGAQLATLVELADAETLLDLGCGKGALAEYARQYLGVRATGADLSEYAVRFARRRAGGDFTVRAAATALPFQAGAFDIVWCEGVLQYLDAADARSALREIARVTRIAAFVSSIAAGFHNSDWARHDELTQLYLSPAQWEALARGEGLDAVALPFEGESAILLLGDAPESATRSSIPYSKRRGDCSRRSAPVSPMLPLRFVESSLERMSRLGALRRRPPRLQAFREKAREREVRR